METRGLSFAEAPISSSHSATYSLLTLPPALVKLLADANGESASTSPVLEIRGNATDAAVLVTKEKTYALRGVQNSNSLCLCSSTAPSNPTRGWFTAARPTVGDLEDESHSEDGHDESRELIEIETILHETLELVPAVARTERLESLLRGTEYTGEDSHCDNRLFLNDLRSELPASDAEIISALRTHRAIQLANAMRGELSANDDWQDRDDDDAQIRRLPTSYLLRLLPAILNSLDDSRVLELKADPEGAARAKKEKEREKEEALKKALRGGGKKSKSTTAGSEEDKPAVLELEVDLDDIYTAVEAAADCGQETADAVLSWFSVPASVKDKTIVRVHGIVRELGLSALEEGGHTAQRLDVFMAKWKALAGRFAKLCVLSLLAGNHIVQMSPQPSTITYLSPTRLSTDPATRFCELFSLKPRWRDTEMLQFLSPDEISGGDVKKRDAVVLKFVRKVKEKDGSTTWTARNLW